MATLKEELQAMVNQMLTENEKPSIEKSSEESNREKQTTTTTTCGIENENTGVCPICNGKGYVFVDYNTIKECECGLWEKERQESKLRFACIPETYKNVRLRDWTTVHYSGENKKQAKAIADSVKNYFENVDSMQEQGKGFYFWSNTKGSGKTMLAAAIANELINKYRRFVKFATSLDILDEIRATFDKNSEDTESKLLNDLVNVEFLVIDDFGTERVSDWVSEKFYQIVNKRYINKKVTFFTSNHDLRNLQYDERVTSRIQERSFLAHFPEQSVREIKAFKENKDMGVE